MNGPESDSNPATDKRIRLFTRHREIRCENPDQASLEPSLRKLRVEVKDVPVTIENFTKRTQGLHPGRHGSAGNRAAAGAKAPEACVAASPGLTGVPASDPAAKGAERRETLPGLVSIVILTFNELDYTKRCVESIRKHTPEPHEIVFVDNGSTDGTVKWLRQFVKTHDRCRLIENRENLGFAKGCNQGIETAAGWDYSHPGPQGQR